MAHGTIFLHTATYLCHWENILLNAIIAKYQYFVALDNILKINSLFEGNGKMCHFIKYDVPSGHEKFESI
jgi:hypothetical protein